MWSGSEDNTIRVWSCFDMSCMHVLSGHRGSICSMVELGIHVWSGSTDQTILVWDATTYQLLYSLGDHGGYVSYLSELVNIQGIVLASSLSTLGCPEDCEAPCIMYHAELAHLQYPFQLALYVGSTISYQ